MKEPGKQWIVRLLLSALVITLALGLFTNAALAENYPVWVGSYQVTSDNKDDILGDGGRAAYDPATQTLTLNDPSLLGTYGGALILVENQDLTISGSAVLDVPCLYGIFASGTSSLALEGDFTVNVTPAAQAIVSDGDLTIAGGTIRANAMTDQAIYAGGSILIQGGDVKAYTNASVGIEAANNINIMDGQVDAKGEKGISAPFIAIDGGTVTATGEGSTGIGIFADGLIISKNVTQVTSFGMAASIAATSAMTIDDSLAITAPEEGVQAKTSIGYTICKSDGVSVATQASLTQAYPLWVGNVRVTGINKNDILHDGSRAVYDPSDNILTLNSPNIPGVHNNAKIFYESSGTLVLQGNAVLTDAVYGVYAQTGSLTIVGDFTTDNVSIGISADQNLWVNGGTLNIKGSSYGLRGDKVSLNNCTVTASAKTAIIGFSSLKINADITAVGDDYALGGYGCDSLTITGGNIQADGGTAGINADSVKFSGGTITASSAVDGIHCITAQIDGNTDLKCSGAENGFRFYTSLMIESGAVQASSSGGNGIYGSSGSANLIMNGGSVTASGSDKGISAGNIIIGNGVESVTADGASNAVLANNLTIGDKRYIIEPFGGINTGTTIVEANGSTVATHAVISGDKLYPVWVGSVQVRESNRNDVLGNGKVSYDPADSRLILNSPSIPNTHAESLIFAENIDLIVQGSATLNGAKYGIRVLHGELTLANASIIMVGIESEALYGVGITIQNSILDLSADSEAIFSDGNVLIVDSNVRASGKLHAIVAVGNVNMSGDITLEGAETAVLTGVFSGHGSVSIGGGSVKSYGAIRALDNFGILGGTVWVDGASNGAAYGIRSTNGGVHIYNGVSQVTAMGTDGAILGNTLTIGDDLGVAEPENGSNDGKQIVEADGVTVATTAVISPLLTVTLDPGEGIGTPIVLGKYPKNATINLPPFPAGWQEPDGKHFSSWLMNNGITTQRYTANTSVKITIVNDTTLTALYYYWITGWEETNGNYAAVDSVNDSGQEIPQKNAQNRMFNDDVFVDIYLKDGYTLLDNAVDVLASGGALLKQYTFNYDGARYYLTFENPKQDVSLRFTVIKSFPVWVGATQVTEANKDDILGDGGSAVYDPAESRLTLNDPSIPDTFVNAGIYAENVDLIVQGSATLPSAKYGIRVSNGKLTLANATISVTNSSHECLTAADVTIQNSTLNLSSDSETIYSDGNVLILDSNVTATGKMYAIVTAGNVNMSGDITLAGAETAVLTGVFSSHGSVSIGGGSVKSYGAIIACDDFGIWAGTVWVDGASNGAAYGIRSTNGGVYIYNEVSQVTAMGTDGAILGNTLTIGDNLGVAVPQNGSNDGKQIVEADGVTVATTAVITPLYTVTLDPGEGIGTPIVLGKYPKNATISLPPFPAEWKEAEGKHFTDWRVDNAIGSNLFNVNSNVPISIISDTTLTAFYYYWITGWEETNGNYDAVDSVGNGSTNIAQKNANLHMRGSTTFIEIYLKDGYTLADNVVQVIGKDGNLLFKFLTKQDGNRYTFTFGDPKQDVSLRFTVDDGIETPSYVFTKGDGAEWVKQSGVPLDFTVKAVGDDTDTFLKFTGIQIDGATVPMANYIASAGSVNLSLKQNYLETLALGDHTIKAMFTDGEAKAKFTVKNAGMPVITAAPIVVTSTPAPIPATATPMPVPPTAKPTSAPRPTAKPVDPDPGFNYKFSFTKIWLGDREDSIQWTLYNSNGVPVSKKFNKRIINENEWVYEAWFSYDASDFYLVETAPDGYMVRYENTGDHAQVTDRCYNGGTITNYKLPKTGDSMPLELIIGWILVGISTVTIALVKKSRKGKA